MTTFQSVRQQIHDAVWQGQINQVSTRDVASHFKCSLSMARRILRAIVDGQSQDERFRQVEGGVKIQDGHRFTYGYENVKTPGKVNGVQHLIWFLD